jgi:enoyl-CoA hydratase/carnithine racemase
VTQQLIGEGMALLRLDEDGCAAGIAGDEADAAARHWPEVLDREVAAQAALFGTADFAEGIAAFRERRSARFTGI